VTINEAMEIAKRYGTDDSSRFINGVLDQIRIKIKESAALEGVPENKDDEK
jgi:transcription termination factor NusB